VFAAQPLDRAEVHLQPVLRLHACHALEIPLGLKQRRELDEVVLKPPGEISSSTRAGLAEALGGGPLIALALDFWTWHRLAAEGLEDDEAAALMARVIAPI
jgi:hypothetical protein